MIVRTQAALLLVASAALFLHGIDWGLPHTHPWHGDSISHGTLHWLSDKLAGFTKYPPVQHLVLIAAYSPYILWLWARGELDTAAGSLEGAFTDPVAAMTGFQLIARLVGVALALCTVWLVVRTVRRLSRDNSAALLAGAIFAASPEVGFFSRIAMVDMPMVFWFAAGLALLVELPTGWPAKRAAALGAVVALGMCTKEQIAGAWVLPPLGLILLARGPRGSANLPSPWRAFGAGTLAWLLTYALASKLVFDPAGWAERMESWLGDATSPEVWGGHPATLHGQLLVLRDTVQHLAYAMGPELLSLAVAGALLALVLRVPRAWLLGATALSYYVFTLASLRYVKTRFVLPLVLLLAILAGLGFAAGLHQRGRLRTAVLAAALLLAGIGAARSWSFGSRMQNDSRYAVEAFLRETLEPGANVEVYADDQYLPRLHTAGLMAERIRGAGLRAGAFRKRRPRAVILAPSSHWKLGPGGAAYVAWLESGSGYSLHAFESSPDEPRWVSPESLVITQPRFVVLLRD